MPLIHGASKEAIGKNIAAEEAAGKPRKQSIAIALDIARRAKRANGGSVKHVGPIHSAVGGRTDHLALDVPSGSYVIPADIVSGLGEGNTANGLAVLQQMFPVSGQKSGKDVPIMAAGGEYVIDPPGVMQVGGGDLNKGHSILDKWVVSQRKKLVKTLSKLPGPARD